MTLGQGSGLSGNLLGLEPLDLGGQVGKAPCVLRTCQGYGQLALGHGAGMQLSSVQVPGSGRQPRAGGTKYPSVLAGGGLWLLGVSLLCARDPSGHTSFPHRGGLCSGAVFPYSHSYVPQEGTLTCQESRHLPA